MKTALLIASGFVVLFFVPTAFSEEQDWSGLYTGVIVGGQFGHSTDRTGAFGYNADDKAWSYDESGYTAGGEAGYNFAVRQIVIGPEIELGYLGMDGSGAQPDSPNGDTKGHSAGELYIALRGRVGVPLDGNLIYATAGLLGANYKKRVVDDCNLAPCGGSTLDTQKTDFGLGFTVGAGIERRLGSGFSIKFEYLYFRLDAQRFTGTTNLGDTYQWSAETSGQILRGGFNYHF
jgi:outer membrane immunogenic protein